MVATVNFTKMICHNRVSWSVGLHKWEVPHCMQADWPSGLKCCFYYNGILCGDMQPIAFIHHNYHILLVMSINVIKKY